MSSFKEGTRFFVASKRQKVQSVLTAALRSRVKRTEPEKAPCAKHKASWEGSAKQFYFRWNPARPHPFDWMVLERSFSLRRKWPKTTTLQPVPIKFFELSKRSCRFNLPKEGVEYNLFPTRAGLTFISKANELLTLSQDLFNTSLEKQVRIPKVSKLVHDIRVATRPDIVVAPALGGPFRTRQFGKFLGYFLRKQKKLLQSEKLNEHPDRYKGISLGLPRSHSRVRRNSRHEIHGSLIHE